jgi:hypothetical protein
LLLQCLFLLFQLLLLGFELLLQEFQIFFCHRIGIVGRDSRQNGVATSAQ